MTAMGQLSDSATARKPGGRAATLSPWLAQTWEAGGSMARSVDPGSVTLNRAWPYSRAGEAATRPPKAWARSCMP